MTEVWLSGPIDGVAPLLQPAAHAFLQVRADIPPLLERLTPEQLAATPGRSASIAYHALHLAGATDRLLTYARGESLSEAQLAAARDEKALVGWEGIPLARRVEAAMDAALDQLRTTPAAEVTAARVVGRQRLPSTVIGLIFHAAEHATRHAGQIVTLSRVLHAGP